MKYDKVQTADNSEFHQNAGDGLFPDGESPPAAKKTFYRHVLYILIAENIFFVLICFICWRTFVPPPTNLRYQSLTPDNKSYPSGQLTWSQHFEAVPCGKSPEEAKARGCRFDMLATAWLPPRCIDYELVDEFTKLGNWQFYTEMHGSTKHSSYEPEVLGSITKPKSIWTSRAWHHMHCLYMWKKIGRALVKGTPADAETVSEPHTQHCMRALEEVVFGPPRDPNENEVYLEIIYPPC